MIKICTIMSDFAEVPLSSKIHPIPTHAMHVW